MFHKQPRKFRDRPRRRNRRARHFALAFVAAYCALSAAALGAEIHLEGRTIRFDPPAGHCLLNELSAGERDAIDAVRVLLRPDHDMLWMFVPCHQLAALRAGRDGRLDHFGYVSAVQPNGVFRSMRGTSRYEFASRVAKSLPPMDATSITRELSRRGTAPGNARFNLLHSGVATMDAAAVYVGSVLEEISGRSRSVTAGLTAITLIEDLPLAVTLHGPFSAMSHQILRTELRPLIGDFITRNERAPLAPRAAGAARRDTWLGDFGRGLVIGGLLSVALALSAVALISSRRSRHETHRTTVARAPIGGGMPV